MADVAEFLLARIAEDEAANKVGPEPEEWCDRGEGLHLGHARVLAECEAKRRIVEHAEPDLLAASPGDPYVLQVLALPYAHHPEFQPEWSVGQATVKLSDRV